ncbi:MAG: hypothetical protein J6X44_04945, partial [Thermoguttaceae bacterium]|nr:hypothetical protein [Thermoguttaceae bacterium]
DAPIVGESITATVSPENAAATWQWYRGTKNQLFKTPIDGATNSSYTPTSEDFGFYLSVRAVGRGDYEGTVSTSTSSTVVDKISSVRLMPSKPSVGTTITATVSPENANVTWQWYRGTSDNLYKTAISGATKSSYTPVAADLGYFISVRAVGKDGYGGTIYASSSASVVDKAGSIELSTDNPAVGTPITATIFPTDADVTWQWYRGTGSELFKTPIDGATGNIYTPTWDDFRCYLSVVAVGKGDYEGTVSTSTNSMVVGKVLSVSLDSTEPSIGKTLTATTSPEDADVTWQWYRGYDWNLFQTPIAGANSRSYTSTAEDSGFYLTVKAVGKGDYEGSVSASTSSAVPYSVDSVKLSTTKPVVGTPLMAKVAPTNAEVSWQWYRGTSDNQFATLIDGADSGSYTPTAADVGFYLSVKAIGKGDYEGTVSASTSTSVVDVLALIVLSTSKPTSGTLITATVSPQNADATWQWYRGTSDNMFQTAISGATANAYEPTDSDVGFYLSVRAVGKGDYEGTVSASTSSPVSGKAGSVALSTDRPAVGTAITATVSPANAEVTWEWYLGTSDDLFKTLIA